jgi:hypothetical protein
VSTAKTVSLGTLLSMSTYVLLTDFPSVHAAIETLAGGPVWTHQLPAAMEALRPSLIAQHPWLDEITPPDLDGEEACAAFLAPLIERYGDQHQLTAAPGGWDSDPIKDALDLMGGDVSRVIPVVVGPKRAEATEDGGQ